MGTKLERYFRKSRLVHEVIAPGGSDELGGISAQTGCQRETWYYTNTPESVAACFEDLTIDKELVTCKRCILNRRKRAAERNKV